MLGPGSVDQTKEQQTIGQRYRRYFGMSPTQNDAPRGHDATGFDSCDCAHSAGNPVPDFDLMTVLCHSNERDLRTLVCSPHPDIGEREGRRRKSKHLRGCIAAHFSRIDAKLMEGELHPPGSQRSS